jgi:uroporphyrin-III C-methyltransferase/precorrin-2 dehydrogenase/sirohydrochlorin ferrochelatase
MQQFPIFLNLSGRTVLIVGEGDAADAKARLVTRAGATVVSEWQPAVTIAFIALDDEAAAATTAEGLRAKGLLVNVVDRPHLCDFTTPAIIDRAPITIAIGTAGTSAGLAKAIRQRIEALLPPSIGQLATALHSARAAIKSRWPAPADRRRALDAALAPQGPLDPLNPASADTVDAWLAAAEQQPINRLETIRIASANPDHLTLQAARLLGEADHIYHAPNIPAAILNRARADAVRHIANAPPSTPPEGLTLWLDF